MNPGAPEEAVKAVGGIIDSLKSQPLSLALVVMNLALLGLVAYIAKTASYTRDMERQEFYSAQKETQQLLAKCIDPQQLQEILKR